MIGLGDPYSNKYGYTIDPTMWLGFALPGAYDGTSLEEEYGSDGFYDYWNLEYYTATAGENNTAYISGLTFALYGETAALDFMFSVFNMPYGLLQQGLGGTYHSITMTVNFDQTGEISGVEYGVRITLPTDGDYADYKGLPIDWDSVSLIGVGDTARDETLDEAIALKESSLAGEAE